MSNLWGVVIAGLLLNFLSLRGYFASYDDAVFGGILIVVKLSAPQGILHVSRVKDVLRSVIRTNKGDKADE